MGDVMVLDVSQKNVKTGVKRKRVELSMSTEEREARIGALREEVDGLMKYYGEFLGEKELVNLDLVNGSNSTNSMIACLLEESSLPLSKLVDSIFEKVKGREGLMTVASVKSSVLSIGQRFSYGVPNPNADLLEDDDSSSLWCWETRDVKLIPKSIRGALKIRRTFRKKIHERITAVFAVITELLKSESSPNVGKEVMKASERLGKVLSEAEIRLLVEKLEQKSGTDVAGKEVIREEKQVAKQLEKSKREFEKEKKRKERELVKEKLQNEKEMKRLHDEAEKEERRREKEESEMKKQLKKQQEEADKDRRRREKEEAEQKRQLGLQKQASLLERFLKKSKTDSPSQNDQSSTKASAACTSPKQKEKMPESFTQSMDNILSLSDNFDIMDLRKLHLNSWYQLGHCSERKRHWGIRWRPKEVVVKELKLTSRELPYEEDLCIEKPDDGWPEAKTDCRSCSTNADSPIPSTQKFCRSKQLLQFDKSHRPAFYGYWPKKSKVVRGRCPLVKDPDLDYEIESDEEWEEEEPGESLSDCDKEEDDESMEEGLSKADDEDDTEDGFFVPDGYLSENEGVEVDRMDCDDIVEEVKNSPNGKNEMENEEFRVLLRQLKHLNILTELALRKNRPLLISNLMHEKTRLMSTQDFSAPPEGEQTCLQALSIRAFPVGPPVVISVGNDAQEEDQQDCVSSGKYSVIPAASVPAISDSDLPEIVSIIRSCPYGINKVVKALHSKFPNIPKSQLGSKVREISVFADNRWQVKKDVLLKLGLSTSPDKSVRRTKSIAAFFSKRCLPPASKMTNPTESSPQATGKASSSVEMQNDSCNQQ